MAKYVIKTKSGTPDSHDRINRKVLFSISLWQTNPLHSELDDFSDETFTFVQLVSTSPPNWGQEHVQAGQTPAQQKWEWDYLNKSNQNFSREPHFSSPAEIYKMLSSKKTPINGISLLISLIRRSCIHTCWRTWLWNSPESLWDGGGWGGERVPL